MKWEKVCESFPRLCCPVLLGKVAKKILKKRWYSCNEPSSELPEDATVIIFLGGGGGGVGGGLGAFGGGVYGCCIMTVLDRRMHQCVSAYLCVRREGKRCPTGKQFICLPRRRTAVITWGGCRRRGTYSNCGGCLLCPRLPNAICERGENDFCTVDTFGALMVSPSLHLKNASLTRSRALFFTGKSHVTRRHIPSPFLVCKIYR